MNQREILTIDRPPPKNESDVSMRSRHYMAFICQRPGVVTMLNEEEQNTRTTAHHIVKRGKSKKGPDWWSVPVSFNRHVHGKYSIDQLGKSQFIDHHGLPSYELMALIFLNLYLEERAYNRVVTGRHDTVSPEDYDLPSARWFFNLLQRLIKNGKTARFWNWEPPGS